MIIQNSIAKLITIYENAIKESADQDPLNIYHDLANRRLHLGLCESAYWHIGTRSVFDHIPKKDLKYRYSYLCKTPKHIYYDDLPFKKYRIIRSLKRRVKWLKKNMSKFPNSLN